VRRIFLTVFGLWLCGLLTTARAETYSLADGTSIAGDIVGNPTDAKMMLRQPDNTYTNIMWGQLSQDSFRQLANNPKARAFVEPFIEVPESERPHKPAVQVKEVTRLELPPKQSFFGALASSSVGMLALLLIYVANIYAGFEVAVVRARPKGLVMGVAAVLPILGPAIFLAMPMYVEPAPAEAQVPVETATFAVPGQPVPAQEAVQISAGSSPKPPAGQVFQRGQFTFNRRFIETKFAGFFGESRTGADANSVLIIKMTSGELHVERITRIGTSDMAVAVAAGEARQEITVPFADIQEIQLKPKAA